MKTKSVGAALLAITLGATCLAGCSNDDDAAVTSTQTTSKTATVNSTVEKKTEVKKGKGGKVEEKSVEVRTSSSTSAPTSKKSSKATKTKKATKTSKKPAPTSTSDGPVLVPGNDDGPVVGY